MRKIILSILLGSTLLLGLVACSSSDYLAALQTPIDEGTISQEEAQELTTYLAESSSEGTQGEMSAGNAPDGELPEGEMPEGELSEGEVPEGELPEGELPEGEIPEGEIPQMGVMEVNPFLGAVEEGIITSEQAETLILSVDLEALMEELDSDTDTE